MVARVAVTPSVDTQVHLEALGRIARTGACRACCSVACEGQRSQGVLGTTPRGCSSQIGIQADGTDAVAVVVAIIGGQSLVVREGRLRDGDARVGVDGVAELGHNCSASSVCIVGEDGVFNVELAPPQDDGPACVDAAVEFGISQISEFESRDCDTGDKEHCRGVVHVEEPSIGHAVSINNEQRRIHGPRCAWRAHDVQQRAGTHHVTRAQSKRALCECVRPGGKQACAHEAL